MSPRQDSEAEPPRRPSSLRAPRFLLYASVTAGLLAACTAKHVPSADLAELAPTPVAPETSPSLDPGPAALEWRATTTKDAVAPMSLTASDGTGLRLTQLRARALLEGPLAFTELDLSFENPESRVREGRFAIRLPPGAAISRFAMKIDGHWQEAEVVERQAARRAYEDFLHRRQDPALLEKDAGNQFRARVFPIPAGGIKEIKVAYSQELTAAAEPYRLELHGLPRLDHLDVDVALTRPADSPSSNEGGHAIRREHLQLTRANFEPRADLEVRFAHPPASQALRAGTRVVARVPVDLDLPVVPLEDLALLVDTSASRALGWDAQVDRIGELVAELARSQPDLPISVHAFDQVLEPLFEGEASEFAAGGLPRLRARRPLGASDLDGALRALARVTHVPPRLVVIGDGVETVGASDHAALISAAEALAERGVQRIDAVVEGGIRDESTLQALTRGVLPQDGVIAPGGLTAASIADKLRRATRSGVRVEVPGARWVWPGRFDGVQAGDELIVHAQMDDANAPIEFIVADGRRRDRLQPPTLEADPALIARSSAMAQVARLQAEFEARPASDGQGREALRAEIVELSRRERVLSDHTALLVLETEADYARFGIDRRALVDILQVGPSGLERVSRQAKDPASPAPHFAGVDAREREASAPRIDTPQRLWGQTGPASMRDEEARDATRERRQASPDPSELRARSAGVLGASDRADTQDEDVWGGLTGTQPGESAGLGGLGLVGQGRGGGGTGAGYGRGSGAAFGGRGRRVPRVRQGRAIVRGSLDRDIIRRIIRRHINEVRACYERRLARDPELAGRVTLDFTIDRTGVVTAAQVVDDQLDDPAVGRCIASAARRWRFPADAAGLVRVRYPFIFAPEGATVETAPPSGSSPTTPEVERPQPQDAWTGRFARVMSDLQADRPRAALAEARTWRKEAPASELALIALGEAAEAAQDWTLASRAYGSLIDLFPSRADLRRMAGERLERVASHGHRPALELGIDTYRLAVEQRPDHPAGHRLLAYALVKAGRHEAAFEAIEAGVRRSYPSGRFAGVDRILREDMALLASAWRAAQPKATETIRTRLRGHGLDFDSTPSTRFVLNWETDANDVDFHVYDGHGGHAYFSRQSLPSGGELYADVTTGYGPECFTIQGEPKAGPYELQAHYYAMGPMGYGMGKLQILEHDGEGALHFTEHPFVIMKDRAFVDLGRFEPVAKRPR